MSSPNSPAEQQCLSDRVNLLWIAKGTVLLVKCGSLLVTAGDQAERIRFDGILLHEGECYTTERGGWYALSASSKGRTTNTDAVAASTTVLRIDPALRTSRWHSLFDHFVINRQIARR